MASALDMTCCFRALMFATIAPAATRAMTRKFTARVRAMSRRM